jgi:hypothetical protein
MVTSSPEIVLLDGHDRHFRTAALKARGYRVFTTQYVVEVCLRWVSGSCAALVIGPEIQWHHVATLCEWIKLNSPAKPIILLSDRRNARWPVPIDIVVPTQPVQALAERLRALLPAASEQSYRRETAAIRASVAAGIAARLRR